MAEEAEGNSGGWRTGEQGILGRMNLMGRYAVEKESPFAYFTPHELYLKFLAEYFRDYLGDPTN